MHERCATVLIDTDNGPVLINESDFDKKTMKLAKDQTIANADPFDTAQIPAAPELPKMLVSQNDKTKKFEVVNETGEVITGTDGIDEAGYETEADAWAAIMNVSASPAT